MKSIAPLAAARRAALGTCLALAIAAPALAQQAANAPIKIGALLSMSGPAAVFGIPERDAITVALEDLNKQGGVNGRPVQVIFYDDRTDAAEAGRGVTQLVSRDGVVAIIGAGTGGNVLAAGPIAERLKVPLLAPVGTIAATDRKNSFFPWVFRVAATDAVNIRVILGDAAKDGAKRIGVFYQEDAYGKTGVDVAEQHSKTLGQEIVATAAAAYTATDLTAQAIKLREAKAQAIFMQVSVASLGAGFVKAARQVGLNVPIYASSGLAQKSFVDASGAGAEGLRVLSIGNLVYDPSPGEKRLSDLLRAAGKTPQGWGELVGTNGLVTAITAAKTIKGEINGQSMRDAVESLCGYESYARGKACYTKDDHDGWKADSLVITEIVNGTLRTRK